MSTALKLKVDIADDDLVNLREQGFHFCISRDVRLDGKLQLGNVVFATVPSQHLAPHIGVQWKDEYQVYETAQVFLPGHTVSVCTEIQDIVGDQEATVDESGHIKISGGYQPGAPFRVDNEWGDQARIGVSNYNLASQTYSSFFVSSEVEKPSTTSLLPMQIYAAFWDKNLGLNSMFDPASVDGRFVFALLPGMAEATLTYKNKFWAISYD